MATPVKAVSTDVCVFSTFFFFFRFFQALLFRVGLFLQPTAHRPILSLGVEAK